jgi:hypothetical protein
MNRKALGGTLLVLGMVLVIVGVLLIVVIVPGLKQFPDDVDTTRQYENIEPMTLLDTNPDDFGLKTLESVILQRHFETEKTDGDKALVYEEQLLLDADENLLREPLVKRYAIDRKSMEHLDQFPKDWSITPGFSTDRRGLVLGWPIDPDKKDYTGWSDDYQATVPLEFVEETTHPRADMDAYYFISVSDGFSAFEEGGDGLATSEIDPNWAKEIGLPAELPKAQLPGLLPEDMRADVEPLLDELPLESLGLAYYYEYYSEYWIEPETGVLLDTHKREIRQAGLSQAAKDELAAIQQSIVDQAAQEMIAAIPETQVNFLGQERVEQIVNDILTKDRSEWSDWAVNIVDGMEPEERDALMQQVGQLQGGMASLAEIAEMKVTVFELSYQATDDSVQDAKADAEDAINQLTLFGTYLPIAAIVIGVLIAIAGAFALFRRRTVA